MESDKKLLFKHVIEYFAIAAIAIQAVFAAFWLFKNIGVFQSDYAAETYILAAESLKVDDRMGILYALVVRLFGHGVVLQVFQLVAVSAGILVALLMVTNPLILQAEMAVSPAALVVACALVAVAAAVKVSEAKWWIAVLFAAVTTAGFLNPDYTYLFFAVLVLYVIVRSIVRKKFDVLLALAVIVAFLVPALVNSGIRDDYAYGRVHRSRGFLALQRTAWPRMFEYAGYIPDFEGFAIGHESGTDYISIMRESDKVPENLAMEVGYKYEHVVGYDHAQDAYWQITGYVMDKGFGYWGHEAIRDVVLYIFSPASAPVAFLKQKTDTTVPCGLEFLFKEAPKASKIYFLFSATATFLFTLMYIVKSIGERVIGQKAPGVSLGFVFLGIIVLLALYAAVACVRGYDYRNVLLTVILWPAGAVALTERKKAL